MKNYTSTIFQLLFFIASVLMFFPATAQVDLTEIIHRINAEGYPQTTYKKSGNLDWTIGNDDGDFNIQQGLNVDAGFLVKVKPNGNVGIGIDPQARLHIDGSDSKLVIGNAGGVLGKLTVNAEPGTEIARFRSDGATKVFIGSDGKVGINTALPAEDLEVEGNVLVEDGLLHVLGTGSNLWVGPSGGTMAKLTVNADPGEELARFRSDGSTKVYIGSNGHVGIGTATPTDPLTVDGNVLVEGSFPFINLDGGIGDNTGLQFNENGTKRGIIFYKDNTDALQLAATDQASSPPQLVLKGDGSERVGMGTSNPDAKLDVQGRNISTEPVIGAQTNYSGTSDVRAVEGNSITADGYGIGGHFTGGYRGVYGSAEGGSYTGSVFGVYGIASAPSGRAYGVYASGDMKCTGQLFVNTTASNEDAASSFELLVNGQGLLEEVKVKNSTSWPDYVFAEDYQLLSLEEMQAFIRENGHLPGIPSAESIHAEGGFFLGDMQKRQLEKIEELSLYTIELHEQNKQLQRENEKMKAEMKDLKSQLSALLERVEKMEKQ